VAVFDLVAARFRKSSPCRAVFLAVVVNCRRRLRRNIHVGSTQRMLNAYNGKLRRYLVDNHYMETLAFHTIPGSTIIDTFGYRECPRQ